MAAMISVWDDIVNIFLLPVYMVYMEMAIIVIVSLFFSFVKH